MRTPILFLLVFCLSVGQVASQQTIELWPTGLTDTNSIRTQPTIKPDRGDNVTRLTDVRFPTLTSYVPTTITPRRQAFIVCPGGGYQHLAIDKEGSEIAAWLNSLGYYAFVLTYRVPNQRDEAIHDLFEAISLVRTKSKELNVDQDKIGVIGFSAGANLAVMAQSRLSAKSPDDQQLLNQNLQLLIYPAGLDGEPNHLLAPGITINEFTPPTFIFTAADDSYANSGLILTKYLREANVPVELHLLPKGGHGYGLRPGNHAAERWPDLAQEWLEKF